MDFRLTGRNIIDILLDSYGSSSTRVVLGRLNTIAGFLSDGQSDAHHLDWTSLEYEHILSVRKWLEDTYAVRTANAAISYMRKLIHIMRRTGRISADKAECLLEVRQIEMTDTVSGTMLSKDEIDRLLGRTWADGSLLAVRDYALLLLLLTTGIRRGELLKLTWADFNEQAAVVYIYFGKRHNSREIYLPAQTVEALVSWRTRLNPANEHLIFQSMRKGGKLRGNQSMHIRAINKIVESRCRTAGIGKFTPHDFRRTYISNLIDLGIDLVTISELAGHSRVTQTAKYDRRGNDAKRKAATEITAIIS